MALTPTEQLVLQEAEQARERALRQVERTTSLVVLAKDLQAAAQAYEHAAHLIAMRHRAAAKMDLAGGEPP